MTENKKNNNICPGCGRGCSLDNPHCPRGEAYARGEPLTENIGHNGAHPMRETRDGNGPHGHHGKHNPHGRHGMHPRRHYDSMDNTEKLLHLLGKLGHQSHRLAGGKSAQHHILHMLQSDGPMTQRELTERLGVQPGSASEILKKLETAGHIRRSPSAVDRRTTDVQLTDEGATQVQAQETARKERKNELLSALSEEEVQQLLTLLEKLSGSWDRHVGRGHRHGPPHGHDHSPHRE